MPDVIPADFLEDNQDEEPIDRGFAQKPIPVKIAFNETERVAPEAAAHMTWQLTAGQPIRICPHAYHRYKAKFNVIYPATGFATGIMLNKLQDPLTGTNPQGSLWGNTLPDYEGQQPLYAVAIGGAATISVIDMTYKVVQ